jgi:hydrogenase nickel incorporation protein HypA/HybF
MHELAICQSLLREVARIAAERQASSITDIHVGIGPLSGVEAKLMQDAFPIAAAGTIAASAALHLRRTDVRVHCESCGAESVALTNRLVCGRCDDWRTTLVSGDELLLERVELAVLGNDSPVKEVGHV